MRQEWIFRRGLADPGWLTVPALLFWEPLDPLRLSLGPEHEGGPWEVAVPGSTLTLELRVRGVEAREQTLPDGRRRAVRRLRWAYRLAHGGPGPLVPGVCVAPGEATHPGWVGCHGLRGLNGWRHLESPLSADGHVIVALVGAGTSVGPFHLPIPRRAAAAAPLPREIPAADTLEAAVDQLLAEHGATAARDLRALLGRVDAARRRPGGRLTDVGREVFHEGFLGSDDLPFGRRFTHRPLRHARHADPQGQPSRRQDHDPTEQEPVLEVDEVVDRLRLGLGFREQGAGEDRLHDLLPEALVVGEGVDVDEVHARTPRCRNV